MRLKHLQLLFRHRRPHRQLRPFLLQPLHSLLKVINFASEVPHCAASPTPFLAIWLDITCISPFDAHLGVFIEEAVAFLPQSLVVHHVDTLQRGLFQFLELVQDLLLKRGGLLGLL